MNLIKIDDDHFLNVDNVTDFFIIDLQDDKGNPIYHILFQLNTVENIKVIANSPDEDDYETSHSSIKEYNYSVRLSKGYTKYDDAKEFLDRIIKTFTRKGEK
jgi:hypothetical protein